MKLIITRHAQSEGNINKSVYFKMPDSSIPITENGKKQAESVAKIISMYLEPMVFKNLILISSPYVRAKQTIDIIAKKISDCVSFSEKEEVLIREREWGNLREEYESFKTREERNHLFEFYRRPIGGESFADCYQRAFIFLEWLKTQKNDAAVIVSHGEFIKTLLMIIDNVKVEDFDKTPRIENCDLIIREI